jgi:signal peptidase I
MLAVFSARRANPPAGGSEMRYLAGSAIVILTLAGCGRVLETVQKTAAYASGHPNAQLKVFSINSIAMRPTLKPGDSALVDMHAYAAADPGRDDVVVFMPPPPVRTVTPFVKRVVAVGGDHVRITGGKLYVNGRLQHEPYVVSPADYDMRINGFRIELRERGDTKWFSESGSPGRYPRSSQPPDEVPNGYYVVLGDNRNDSEDSHVFGFVRRSAILGKLVEVF